MTWQQQLVWQQQQALNFSGQESRHLEHRNRANELHINYLLKKLEEADMSERDRLQNVGMAPDCVPASQIDQQLTSVDEMLDQVSKHVDCLEQRLIPVMNPEAVPIPSQPETEPVQSVVAARIKNQGHRISDVCDRLQTIENRLEV